MAVPAVSRETFTLGAAGVQRASEKGFRVKGWLRNGACFRASPGGPLRGRTAWPEGGIVSDATGHPGGSARTPRPVVPRGILALPPLPAGGALALPNCQYRRAHRMSIEPCPKTGGPVMPGSVTDCAISAVDNAAGDGNARSTGYVHPEDIVLDATVKDEDLRYEILWLRSQRSTLAAALAQISQKICADGLCDMSAVAAGALEGVGLSAAATANTEHPRLTLDEARRHIGRRVAYHPGHGPAEEGAITSVGHVYVFVRYGPEGTTSQATAPHLLELLDDDARADATTGGGQ